MTTTIRLFMTGSAEKQIHYGNYNQEYATCILSCRRVLIINFWYGAKSLILSILNFKSSRVGFRVSCILVSFSIGKYVHETTLDWLYLVENSYIERIENTIHKTLVTQISWRITDESWVQLWLERRRLQKFKEITQYISSLDQSE